jgi:hypothetical protein
MKSSETVLEPRLAWALWQGLGKLSDLLWDRYKEEFLKLAEEERVRGGSEEDREARSPFNRLIIIRRRPENRRGHSRPREAQSWASHWNFGIWIRDDGWPPMVGHTG